MIAKASDLRPWEEIQKAHDMLEAILQGEVDLEMTLTDKEKEVLWQGLGVLCWVLQHDRAKAFEGLLAGLRDRLALMGIGEFRIS